VERLASLARSWAVRRAALALAVALPLVLASHWGILASAQIAASDLLFKTRASQRLRSTVSVARVAGVAAGLWGWESGRRAEAGAVLHEPAAASAAMYRERYGVYRDLYTRLAPVFAAARGARDEARLRRP
jgi:hypothetical protein